MAVHSGETNLNFETFIVWADGTRRDVTARWSVAAGHEDTYARILFTSIDVTERKRAEEALRASEERFRGFSEASSDWFWEMDADCHFSHFSDRFTEITGVRQEALLGKTREETGIPDIDPEAWDSHLSNLAERRPFRDFRHPRTRPDGRVVHLSINGKPTFDEAGNFKGYRGTGSDITEHKRAEEDIHRLSLRNELILNSAGEGIYGLDLEGRTTFVNPAAARMIGWEPGDLIGQPLHDILHHSKPDGSPYPREEYPILAALRDGAVAHPEGSLDTSLSARGGTDLRSRRAIHA